MNHFSRHSALSIAAAVLLALVVGWAAHPRAPSGNVSGASFGEWIVATFPTPEAGFARRAQTVGD